MTRNCAVCGKPFEATRKTAKYCGSTCRARQSKGVIVAFTPPPQPDPWANDPPLVAAVRSELDGFGRASSALGLAAIELAFGVASGQTPPAAKATLTKELRATLEAAVRGATTIANPVDELRSRRDRKRTGTD